MRTTLIAFATLILLLPCSCTPGKDYVATGHTYGSASDSVFFSLERTPCFGKCAAYTVTIDKFGNARWIGRSNTDRPGTWKAQVSTMTMERLLSRANSIGFFDMEDRYDGQVTDLPSTIIRVNANGKDKKVVARYKIPPAFKPFAAFADSLLMPLAWTQVAADQ